MAFQPNMRGLSAPLSPSAMPSAPCSAPRRAINLGDPPKFGFAWPTTLSVRNFGPINLTTICETTDPDTGETRETHRRPNLQPFLDDPDVWLVASIEDYDLESGKAKQGPIFSANGHSSPGHAPYRKCRRRPCRDPARCWPRRSRSYSRTPRPIAPHEAHAELGDRLFLDPQLTNDANEIWQTADAYLSGPVRTKLVVAIEAAAIDPRYQRNVDALQGVQPEDLEPSDISARLGAPWISAEIVASFSAEMIGIKTFMRHTVEIAAWTIDLSAFAGHAAATSEWGTARRHAGQLLSDALNAAIPQIYDVFIEDGKEHRVSMRPTRKPRKEKLGKNQGRLRALGLD